MKISAVVSRNVADLFAAEVQAGKRVVKTAMVTASNGLKLLLRDQVMGAGLGSRVANAWRNETYPKGRDSLNAAAYVWSKAPAIHAAFDAGALIRRDGGLWLAIPTEHTPRSRGARGATRLATPSEVEDQFNQDLILKPDPKNPAIRLLVLRVVKAKSKRGWRKGTPKRLAQGRDLQDVIMFVLVRQVRLPKKLDIDRAVAQIAAQIPTDIALAWANGGGIGDGGGA